MLRMQRFSSLYAKLRRCISHLINKRSNLSLLVSEQWPWLRTMTSGISPSTYIIFEYIHRTTLKDKRPRRKNHNTIPTIPDQTFSCNCACLSCISLMSHEHAFSQCGPMVQDNGRYLMWSPWAWNNGFKVYTKIALDLKYLGIWCDLPDPEIIVLRYILK